MNVSDRREISSVVRLGLNLELVANSQRGGDHECDACAMYMGHMEAGRTSTAPVTAINPGHN